MTEAETVAISRLVGRRSTGHPTGAAILAIAQRDITKFLSDRARLVGAFILPFLIVLLLGKTFQGNLGKALGYNYLTYVFTGVYAQTLFQSSAAGLVSLIDDRANDFSQELFVAPVSRYAIIFGKILGEALVAFVQAAGILVFALVIGVRFSLPQAAGLVVVGVVVCFFGGAFGVFVLSMIRTRRAADQLFTFIFLPQFFLAGVFSPIPTDRFLAVLSRMTPMRYAIGLERAVFYRGTADAPHVLADSLWLDAVVVAAGFAILLVVGTTLFVRHDHNR